MEELFQPLYDYLKTKRFFWFIKPLFFAISLIILYASVKALLQGL